MTAQEIQALINAKIAGQGSAVDAGSALPQILSGILELAQSGGDAPKPIVITELPNVEDTLETLAAKGLTYEEISAAISGKRTGVVYVDESNNPYQFFTITRACFLEPGVFNFAFEDVSRSAVFEDFTGMSFSISNEGGEATVVCGEL